MKVFEKDAIPESVSLFSEDYLNTKGRLKSPKEFEIRRTENTFGNNFVKKSHYLHRKLYIARNVTYGIFVREHCFGVVMYGFPVWKVYPGLVPPMEPAECPELLRLCTVSDLPKNTESFLIGRTLRLLKNDWKVETGTTPKCVTSFCDIGIGFNGALYKATNFKLICETMGRPANPGKAHGKWGKNEGQEAQLKQMWAYYFLKPPKI